MRLRFYVSRCGTASAAAIADSRLGFLANFLWSRDRMPMNKAGSLGPFIWSAVSVPDSSDDESKFCSPKKSSVSISLQTHSKKFKFKKLTKL